MTFLLDTNVVSEWVRPRPDAGVINWLADTDEDRIFLSVVSLAELRSGIAVLPAGRRRERLDTWLSVELPDRFEARVLAIDAAVADQWGKMTAAGKTAGRPIGAMDAFLAATATVHDLTIVTRNVADFANVEVATLSPWLTD
ncbi:MAG: type II toxin-antitoxin system VapC family toxin [Xanthobacteraceae bacterium]|nr:type II toxin-antitoxin system VapC family toxin [Xanthobacteraceae bacterium]